MVQCLVVATLRYNESAMRRRRKGFRVNNHHPANDHRAPERDSAHPDIRWFLRRELISLPLAVALVATLLIFGISPATLLFVLLLTIIALGWIWSGK